jgi:hypothetical protein
MDEDRPAAPRFDAALDAWVLARHADVVAALREPRLTVGGEGAGAHDAHAAVRESAARALAPERVDALRAATADSARRRIAALPAGEPIDLVSALIAPWALELAARTAGIDAALAASLAAPARALFLAAAHATDAAFPPHAQAAAAELARALAGASGWADVQAFVALSQTLAAFVAGAWRELLLHPAEAARLRAEPALVPRAVEELLRLGGPSRAVFRTAGVPLSLGGATIAVGARVVLVLAAANRDPARFPDPDRLDLDRPRVDHLAFGRGAHVCPGAPLIRASVAAATEALLTGTAAVEPAGDVAWQGGLAIRAPASLPVVLRRAP